MELDQRICDSNGHFNKSWSGMWGSDTGHKEKAERAHGVQLPIIKLLCCGCRFRGWTHYFFMLLILGLYGLLGIGSRSSPLVLLNGLPPFIVVKSVEHKTKRCPELAARGTMFFLRINRNEAMSHKYGRADFFSAGHQRYPVTYFSFLC